MNNLQGTVLRSAHIEFLQVLCLGLLKQSWQNDEEAASVASALLTATAQRSPFEHRGKVFEKRAHRALILLRQIEAFQDSKEKKHREGEYPDRYPKTKIVLWEALLLGALMSEMPKRQRFLARNLLSVCIFGLPGEEGEPVSLEKTLQNVLFNYQVRSDRIGAVLKECTEESNHVVARVLGHAYVDYASPNDIARMCKA